MNRKLLTALVLVGAAALWLTHSARADLVYRTDSNAGAIAPRLDEYNTATNTWTARAALPATNFSQLASDGSTVYAMPTDNNIYRYDRGSDSWAFVQTGPNAPPGPIDMFETYHGEFYAAKDGTSTLYYTVGGVWNSITTPREVSSASGLDLVNGQIYDRTWFQLGGFVYDIATNTFPKIFDNTTIVQENSRSGEYYQGYFYDRTFTGNLIKVDPNTGLGTDTGVPLATTHSATAIVDGLGLIYLNGYSNTEQTFEVFNINAGTETLLANAPAFQNSNGHSTLAVVVPEPSSFAMSIIGLLGLLAWRRHTRSAV